MRTIPEAMLAQFKEQQGLNIYHIIEITWPGDETILYSTCEFPDQEIYAYVKEFKDFESVSHVEGLGAVSTVTVEFFDQFGHFKEKIDTVDFFNNTTCTLYLTLDGVELFDLFEGKISDNATWKSNIFTIEVKSKNIEKEVGFQPSMDDIDEELEDPDFYAFLERHLKSDSTWPAIFGTVKNYTAPAVWTQRYAEVLEDVDYESGGLSYYQILIDQTEDFNLDTDYFVNLAGKEQSAFSLLGTGQFKKVTIEDVETDVFRLTKSTITSTWYQNIAFTILPTAGIAGINEEIPTRIQIAPGPVTIDEVELSTLGPDGEETEVVWLQFMKLEFRYSYTVGATTITKSRYLNCVKQRGNICELNETLSIREDAFDIYIRKVAKSNDIIYQIPKGSQIYIMGDRLSYILDTKDDTTVDSIHFKNGEELVEISSEAYEVLTTPLWDGDHPPVTYVRMLAEVYMRFLEHYALKDKEGEGILASCHNVYNTEAEVIASLSDLPTIDLTPKIVNFGYYTVEDAEDIIPEIAWQANKAVRYTRVDNDDSLELIDLTDTSTPSLHIFNEYNVMKDTVVYGFTSKDDLYTVFNADFQTNDMLKELEVIKYKKNVAKYEESLLDVDYYIFKNKADAETHFQFWRDKLSEYHYTITFTGFMDAFGLEVWDRVSIELDTSTFYDPTDGTPFVNTHAPEPQRWHSQGRIKRMSPNLVEGTIEFFIELDTILGVSTEQEGLLHGF